MTMASLDELLARLDADPRHRDLRILYREPLVQRNFADWSMSYGPCVQAPDQDGQHKLLALGANRPVSATRVPGLFFSLLDARLRPGACRPGQPE
jgi:hypothetical protein